ncbi:DedA family protein [Microbacterium sp. cx-55]|uniref:DedA family protein n=1 Tax=unclassified Microbacterium TaxID=2609290 RepID=UPI001CBCCDBB|nr:MULTISPECIES: DedA family protein [unclassified Microbacterium]MBZ4486235.1 DedA family protein [Microbacterium sp. cx-55]MCC4907225.1 DedA family protein [Microbacterium sp. cx-59]UGB33899.1 DedA family protein [Microbacterium sp. cx-55]
MNDVLTWILDAVSAVDPGLRIFLAGIAIMLETSILVGLIVPGDTVVIVAGTAVETPLQGILLGVAVVVGSLLGESIGYFLGRWLGPAIRASRLGRRIGEANWRRSERYLERRGGPAIFLSRFLPVLHSLVPLTVGMTGYSYRRFLAWTAPACILWATLYIGIAAAAAGTYRELADQIHFAGYIFVGIIVVFLVLIFIAKKVIERVERRHMTDPDADHAPDATRARGDMED